MHTDCRQFRISQPCEPHKQTGVRCDGCAAYDPVRERVLIVKLAAIGDVLRTTSCLVPLKERYPRCHVTWVTRESAVPIVQGNPFVDRVLPVESNYLELLLSEQFDLMIAPDADPLSAAIAALATSGTKHGFVADGRGGVRATNAAAERWWQVGLDDGLKRENRRTYGEWLYDMCGFPAPVARPMLVVPEETRLQAARTLRERAPHVERWICFNTGGSARWREKRWRRGYYARLARLIVADDRRTGILLVGGPDERDLNREMLLECSDFTDGGTANALPVFAALLSLCDWVLTGDTLGYHVACAVGTPACCLVGPTSPWELDRFDENVVVHAAMDCIACYRATCPLTTTCMDVLTPEAVWKHITAWRAAAESPRLAVV